MSANVPDFAALKTMFRREVEGLTEAQLDWDRPGEEWARWSIRRQISHVALAYFFWWARMWGKTLWPDDPPADPVDFRKAAPDAYDRRLDEEKYWALDDLLPKFDEAVDLALRATAGRSAEELGAITLTRTFPETLMMGDTDLPVYRFWAHVSSFHPDGLDPHPDDETTITFTLGGMARHLYWEALVHLRTIQRLKAAQGLPPAVDLPREGYLADPFFRGPEEGPAP